MLSQQKGNVIMIREDELDQVTQDDLESRSKGQFREARLQIPQNIKATAQFNVDADTKQELQIINLSKFGARIYENSAEPTLHINQTIRNLHLRVDGHLIFQGDATVMNEGESNSYYTYGISIQGYGIDLERIRAMLETRSRFDHYSGAKTIISLFDLVRPEFKIRCAHLNALFQDLRMRLTEEQERIQGMSVSDVYKRKLEEQAVDLAMNLYQSDIHAQFRAFQEIVDNLSAEERIVHKRFFRTTIHPLLGSAPFINRAYTKPLGYAGDYGLMIMFYDYKDQGESLFDKFMHRYACNEPASVANKNRVEYLAEQLLMAYGSFCKNAQAASAFKITSVACGPAKEIELFLSQVQIDPKHPLEIILIDQEPRALDYAQSRIRSMNLNHSLFRLTLLAEDAVLGIIKNRSFCQHLSDSNVIVSAGLFDYLSDRVAEKLIAALYSRLALRGTLFIGNVSTANPDRFSMEFVMEWQLILRDEASFPQLLGGHPPAGAKVRVVSEPLGLNLFLEITRMD